MRVHLLAAINSVRVRLVQINQIVWRKSQENLSVTLSFLGLERSIGRRSWCGNCRKDESAKNESLGEEHDA